ncbi:MAG: DUF4159 domain-containing protein [Verrucomicrobiota bacterium]
METHSRQKNGEDRRKMLLGTGLSLLALGFFSYRVTAQETARQEAEWEGINVTDWEISSDYPEDIFTFVRLKHSSKWTTDFPDSDLNFSFRLQELTSWEVDPDGKVFDITDPELMNYPFALMSNPNAGHARGVFQLDEEEVEALQRYFKNGGFVMVDDFWGDAMWENFQEEMEKVFPDVTPREIKFDARKPHGIFSSVFAVDKAPQVPSHDAAERWRDMGLERTYEPMRGESEDALNTPHFWAYQDDKGRIMMLVCHNNNDLADGWEEEGFKVWFFKEFAEKYSYPMGINILFHTMTH